MKYHFHRRIGSPPAKANISFNNEKQKVISSLGIEIDIKEFIPFLQLIKDNKLKVGDRLNKYMVLEITDDYIQICCHIIPVKDFENLIERLGL